MANCLPQKKDGREESSDSDLSTIEAEMPLFFSA
jgi:hypothetical protein